MDSEHRHDLEENWLAKKLAAAIEDVKPRLPAYALALVVVGVAIAAINGYRASAEDAKAARWGDFAQAMQTGQANPQLLEDAAAKHSGTPAGEWAEVTWADSRLYAASAIFFRNRTESDKAVEEAVAVYERLVSAKSREVAQRAGFQLARAYELQGKLDEAVDQYGRVTGAFDEVAAARAEELGEEGVRASYSWISATKTAPGATESAGDAEPDDLDLPEADPDETLGSLLDEVGTESETLIDETPAEETTTEEPSQEATEEATEAPEAPAETAEEAAEEAAESSTEATE